jgi:DNA-binding NtrC family response regulator
MGRHRVLVVDDEVDMLEGLKRLFSYELQEVEVLTASEGRQALSLVRSDPPDLVLLDIRMPEMDGFQLLESLRHEAPWLTVIMMTAYGSIEVAVEAMKHGAYDFITKPFNQEALLRSVQKGLERNRLIRENRALRRRLGKDAYFQGLVGQSPPMLRLYQSIQAIADTGYTVLIRGESGTGKELVARALHDLSPRGSNPLVSVSCPAIPEHLLESELFGYKKGAFTGADREHRGLFQEAQDSTLFLDEIADIPVSLQTKLLRVLQEHEIKPLGASRGHKVDVRILASTNQDLEVKIQERTFREDLYYRLNVVTLRTPALKEIPEDIPLLADHFTRLAAREMDRPDKRLTGEALEELSQRSWPGNARELQNFVRRLVMFSAQEEITAEEVRRTDGLGNNATRLAFPGLRSPDGIITYKPAKERLLNEFTQAYVTEILQQTRGNVSQAAELSGIGRASFQKILRRLGIKPDKYRSG